MVGAGAGAAALGSACVCAGCCGVGREIEATEGFLRSWLLDAGDRS